MTVAKLRFLFNVSRLSKTKLSPSEGQSSLLATLPSDIISDNATVKLEKADDAANCWSPRDTFTNNPLMNNLKVMGCDASLVI
eukprot:SAG31_NODE_806_length_11957_cov_2.232670_5_plen_83_part_00